MISLRSINYAYTFYFATVYFAFSAQISQADEYISQAGMLRYAEDYNDNQLVLIMYQKSVSITTVLLDVLLILISINRQILSE